MSLRITLDTLLAACGDDSFEDGIRIDTELDPTGGPGSPVKPAVYEGGQYQTDRRWEDVKDEKPTDVIIIDNVPSQANRLEDALRRDRQASVQKTSLPELVLDLSGFEHLPPHLPRRISSLQFPHRNADSYLRDAQVYDAENGIIDFSKTPLGKEILGATTDTCGPLMAWFPQALLYGFWQSHLGKKRSAAKHARAWVSEIVGWKPATSETRTFGVKGDPLNLSTDEKVTANEKDQANWGFGGETVSGGKKTKLSEIGHGQVPFMGKDATAAPVSFTKVTQRATVSFAQLRRISLGRNDPSADAAARAVLVALGLHAHVLAFGRGFALRSGAELRPRKSVTTWLGSEDETLEIGSTQDTRQLLQSAIDSARNGGVPLDGWGAEAIKLTPKSNLEKAITATWPEMD